MHVEAEKFLIEFELYRLNKVDLTTLCSVALSRSDFTLMIDKLHRPYIYFNIYSKDYGLTFVPLEYEGHEQYRVTDLLNLIKHMAS